MTVVRLEDVDLGYGGRPVVRAVTADARAGEVTAVIGPNASGKSTLLRGITGAVAPVRGRIHVDDHAPHRLHGRALAVRIAFMDQRPEVAAAFTAGEVVRLARYAVGPDEARVRTTIERLELDDLVDEPFATLSVGQQQRVALARTLAQGARCIVLDEPTAAMDLAHQQRALSILREEARAGATVVLAVHDLTAVRSVADHAWLMHEGRLAARGEADEVLTADRLSSVFGVPFRWYHDEHGAAALLPASPPEP